MIRLVTTAVLLLGAPVGAVAAPFCLALSTGSPQCIYYDGASCARDAGRQNGSCQPNPAETHVTASRIGEYCLVMPSGYTTCGYSDGAECARDAIAQKGACARSAGALPRQLPDSFEPNAGR